MFGVVALAIASIVSLSACSDDNSSAGVDGDNGNGTRIEVSFGTLVDERDGQSYKTAKIGNQVWMAENSNFETSDRKESFCYDNDPANCETYGHLYTARAAAWFACPAGWHLPSKEEFETLIENVGKNNLQAKGFGSGTDPYGFSALPAGHYSADSYNGVFVSGKFGGMGESTGFWSSTEPFYLSVFDGIAHVITYGEGKFSGRYVRCLQNESDSEDALESSN